MRAFGDGGNGNAPARGGLAATDPDAHQPRLSVSALALAASTFVLASVLLFGVRVTGDFAHSYIGANGPDPKLFVWSMEWWSGPAFGLSNPFHADVIWAPGGYDLTWATTVPGPAILVSPLTRLFGPIAGFNSLMLAAPVLAALSAFVLCAVVTRRFWPSVAGGYFFGFSSYMLAHIRGGHLNLLLTFPIPLLAAVVVLAVTQRMSRRHLGLWVTALLMVLFSISTELFATTTVVGGMALLLAYVMADRELRHSIRGVLAPITLGYVLALVIVSPFLLAAFVGPIPVQVIDVSAGSTDLLNPIVPTSVTWLRGWGSQTVANSFAGSISGHGAYVGVPLLLAGGMAAWQRRRRFEGKLLTWLILISFLLSLGPVIRVAGDRTGVPGPGAILGLLPLIEKAHLGRFFLFTSLGLAVLIALFLSTQDKQRWRWSLVLLGFCLLLPAPRDWVWRTTPETPAFFAQGRYRTLLDSGDNILVLSRTSALALLWQSEARMEFSMPVAYTGGTPSASHPASADQSLYRQQCPGETLPSSFWETLHGWGVKMIIVADTGRESEGCPSPIIEGADMLSVGGVSIYTQGRG